VLPSIREHVFTTRFALFVVYIIVQRNITFFSPPAARYCLTVTVCIILTMEKQKQIIQQVMSSSQWRKETGKLSCLTGGVTPRAILGPLFIKFSRKTISCSTHVPGGLEPVYIILLMFEAPASPSTTRVARGRISAKLVVTILPALNRVA
jgi:hypothetical protein